MASEAIQARLHSILSSLSESPRSSVSDLTHFLDSISDSALSELGDEDAKANAFEALSQLHQYVSDSPLTEETFDELSFRLPSVAARFGGVSDECSKIAVELIEGFVSMGNPRDMLSILCEALAYSGGNAKAGSGYFAPVLAGISKVFVSIQRRHFEQVKSAVPIILNVIKVVALDQEYENEDLTDVFDKALSIANSIKDVCTKLDGVTNEKLRALLGLYVLQIMALASFSNNCDVSSSDSLVAQLSSFFPYCSLSYLGLITGCDVDRMTNIAVEENEDDFMSCLTYAKHGASLSVIWRYILLGAKEDLTSVEDELKTDREKRWQAFGTLKHVLGSPNIPWKFKKHAIDIILCITDTNISTGDEDFECLDYVPSLFAALKAVQTVLMFSSDRELRRNAFVALKNILADVPAMQRFDILKSLIRNADSPSMIAILLDIVRSELHREKNNQRTVTENGNSSDGENKAHRFTPFWSSSVIEFVETVLRPPKGGPPDLPEHCESVVSALNLYRFILITESTGKTNHTGVLSKDNLQKSHDEWLLPLRTLVTGIMAENRSDHDQFAVDTVCAINPIELVLYRCIELVEEKLKQTT